MISTLRQFFKNELYPRRRDLLTDSSLIISFIVAVLFQIKYRGIHITDFTIGGLFLVLMAYATITFGFCLSGITLTFIIPNTDFILWIASHHKGMQKDNTHRNFFSELLFIFIWTGILHWLLIITSLFIIFNFGWKTNLVINSLAIDGIIITIIQLIYILFIQYCLLQFLWTLFALHQVSSLYLRHLISEEDKEKVSSRKE